MEIKLPLNQHVGLLSKPVVRVGDEVEKGELIAEEDKIGTNIHSSVYGRVKNVTEELIIIKADKKQPASYQKIRADDKLDMIKQAGLVDKIGFPLHIKYSNKKNEKVFLLDLSSNNNLEQNLKTFREEYKKIIRGIKLIEELVAPSKGYILISQNLFQFNRNLRHFIEFQKDLELITTNDSQIRATNKLEVLKNSNHELLIENIETVKKVTEAVDEQKPYISKDLAIDIVGPKQSFQQTFFDLPLGLPLRYFSGNYCLNGYGELLRQNELKDSEQIELLTKILNQIKINFSKEELKQKNIVESGYIRGLNYKRKKEAF